MKLFLQTLFFFLACFTNSVNASTVFSKVTIPSYEFSFSKTENLKGERIVKISVSNFARSDINENSSFQKANLRVSSVSENRARVELKGVVSGAGSVLRKIDDFIPSSSTQLIGNTNKTTTLLGRWNPDMQVIKGKMLPNEFNVGTEFGTITSNNGGFNFLNIETSYNPATFFEDFNKPWLLKAIERGDDIILATRPINKADFIDATTGKLLGNYADELKILVQQKYKPINLSTTEWNTIKTWFP